MGARIGSALDVPGWSGDDDELASDPRGLAAWVNVWNPAQGRSTSVIGVHVPCLDTRAPWRDTGDAEELLAALTMFNQVWGDRWYFSPNETARTMITRCARRLQVAQLPPPADRTEATGRLTRALSQRQSRPLLDIEEGHLFVHEWDLTAQHVAAMTSGIFGNGKPANVQEPVFDPKRAGYWRITEPTGLDMRMPRMNLIDGSWVVTETVKVLRELGARFDITEAWLYPESGRYLETIGNKFRDALYALRIAQDDGTTGAGIARRAIPYKTFSGMLARSAGPRGDHDVLWRPDWNDVILATADANLMRHVKRIADASGMYPVANNVDALFYTSEEHSPDKAKPEGMRTTRIINGRETTGIGWFKHAGCVPVAALSREFGELTFPKAFRDELERKNY